MDVFLLGQMSMGAQGAADCNKTYLKITHYIIYFDVCKIS